MCVRFRTIFFIEIYLQRKGWSLKIVTHLVFLGLLFQSTVKIFPGHNFAYISPLINYPQITHTISRISAANFTNWLWPPPPLCPIHNFMPFSHGRRSGIARKISLSQSRQLKLPRLLTAIFEGATKNIIYEGILKKKLYLAVDG